MSYLASNLGQALIQGGNRAERKLQEEDLEEGPFKL
jgi:hypothetical protein